MIKLFKFIIILGFFLIIGRLAVADDVLVLDENDMAKAVADEIANQGLGDDIEVEFFGGKTKFTFKDVGLVKIMINSLKLDEEQSRFVANAEIFAEGEMVESTRLSGKYYVKVAAFVPARTIEKGTIITNEMLKEISVRGNRVKDNIIIEKDKLIGLQAKKMLKEGKLVAEREVGQTIVVRKGDVVTAVYKSKGLQITSKSEALEDGAKGQRIELANTKSGKKFSAKVIDATTVEIDNE